MSIIVVHSTLNISETVRDRGLIPKDHQQEMPRGLSNGHVTLKVQTRDPNTLARYLENGWSILGSKGLGNGIWAIKWSRDR